MRPVCPAGIFLPHSFAPMHERKKAEAISAN